MTAPEDTPKPRRRWLRFSLRTLLVVMLLFGVVFGVLGMMAREARRQRKVVADLEEMGAIVIFRRMKSRRCLNCWIRDIVVG